MFVGVNEKLQRAEYFLNSLRVLASEARGFSHIRKQVEMRANLDGFFFEIISAKDFFLQGINDKYKAGLQKDEATKIDKLKYNLSDTNALKAVKSIKELLSDNNSWLWRLNNYRNSATHRELLHFGTEVELGVVTNDKELLDKAKQKKIGIKLIFAEKNGNPTEVPIYYPPESIKTYLFKDPEDPSKGNVDIEVLPYCEQSLAQMKELLERLYSELGL